ncbi:G-protein coupled receptor GRL101-like [Stylophora pistillata]|uniref:G-protein coupled receptor GRL101-like n=1 Tax=Stylophora pistillata TaxID=50429 RepID=UPI000C03C2A1|nr:G-protein coupled receptor GRL101-like [Stylophora pistillata]
METSPEMQWLPTKRIKIFGRRVLRMAIKNYLRSFILKNLNIFHESGVVLIAPNNVTIIKQGKNETIVEKAAECFETWGTYLSPSHARAPNALCVVRNLYSFECVRERFVTKLDKNKLKSLPRNLLTTLDNLTGLYLAENNLESLPKGIFSNVRKLQVLTLSNNRIPAVTNENFNDLPNLVILYMHKNEMSELPNGFFDGMKDIMKVIVDTNLMCCHLTKEDAQWTALYDDSFASCESMFRNSAPRKSIWAIGILSLLGAVFVIVWRLIFKERNVVQLIMLMHLAVGDGLMGVYLVTLGAKDLLWSGSYYLHDFQWRSGLSCQVTGAISVLSSEVSVMLLALISADRLKNIVFPYRGRGLTLRKAHILCAIIWVLGFVIAFLPLSGIGYFYDTLKRPAYYGRSVVCLPMQLSKSFPAGWEFSIAIFVVFNFLLFLFMMVAYVAIFLKSYNSSRQLARKGTIREVQAKKKNLSARRERALAKRVFFIILTDCACWMPIIVIGIKSLVDKDYSPQGDLAAWIAVFVLPINSALNPIIYTLSTRQVQGILRPKLLFFTNRVRSFFSCCKKQPSHQVVVVVVVVSPTRKILKTLFTL